MEETKYYTPAPEDIRPGLVYEYRRWPEEDSCEWDKRVLPENGSIMQNILERLNRDTQSVRVPHLTAEQIEAEGWQITNKGQPASSYIYNAEILDESNGEYSITYFSNIQTIQVFDFLRHTVFNGKCRCINDFRLICKLLGI